MLFNSFQFLIFLPVVISIYFALAAQWRRLFLLLASYFFYMCWRPEYVLLIIVSTVIDYYAGLEMGKQVSKQRRKKYLVLSLLSNLGILTAFKYYNLFSSSVNEIPIFHNSGFALPVHHLLLPVGISFYTFQTLSYSIDVYRGKQKAERNFITFSLYVTFFPQLVAGPIERSTRLLPQFYRHHEFNPANFVTGLRLILWGFFKKVLIADRLAIYVDAVFNNQAHHGGQSLFLATVFFSIQIYCDFSGYSDIAIGSAKMMGYDLMENFRRPYFSRSIRDFWTRWHISLSSWFRDYLYISLGGNRVVKWRWYYNLFIVFLVSGLWHGANWTFLLWGAIHGTYLIVAIVAKKSMTRISDFLLPGKWSRIRPVVQMFLTYALVCFAWIFFRANSVADAFEIVHKIALFEGPVYFGKIYYIAYALFGIGLLFLVELKQESNRFGFEFLFHPRRPVRYFSYASLIILILLIGVFDGGQFIYFQF